MNRYALPAGVLATLLLAACGGNGTSGGTGTTIPTALTQSNAVVAQSQSIADSVDATAPLVIHVGFNHAALKMSKYGPVAFYAPNAGATQVITVKAASKVVFLNDDTTRHTASGLGSTGFPTEFDNKSATKAVGTTINGGLTWASGSLNPGAKSKPFTVGPKGTYYFGCYYHYHVTPNMRDVIVSQ